MAKNFRQNQRNLQTVQLATKNRSKKGRLKGSNKKETKTLRLCCPHHYYNKKGVLKSATFAPNNNDLICEQCLRKIHVHQTHNSTVKKTVKTVKGYLRQLQFANVEINGGEKVQKDINELMVRIDKLPKLYKKIFAIVGSMTKKPKNKKKRKKGGSTQQWGTWEATR